MASAPMPSAATSTSYPSCWSSFSSPERALGSSSTTSARALDLSSASMVLLYRL